MEKTRVEKIKMNNLNLTNKQAIALSSRHDFHELPRDIQSEVTEQLASMQRTFYAEQNNRDLIQSKVHEELKNEN